MASWNCQLCSVDYVSLPDLVSHIRASHSQDVSLNFVCGVSQCPKIFRNANTWYKHVVKSHRIEYFNNVESSSDTESEINEIDEGEQCDSDNDSPDNFDLDMSVPPYCNI